jgi:hypothetical protein
VAVPAESSNETFGSLFRTALVPLEHVRLPLIEFRSIDSVLGRSALVAAFAQLQVRCRALIDPSTRLAANALVAASRGSSWSLSTRS